MRKIIVPHEAEVNATQEWVLELRLLIVTSQTIPIETFVPLLISKPLSKLTPVHLLHLLSILRLGLHLKHTRKKKKKNV